VQVALLSEKADVQYDPSKVQPEQVARWIDELGFRSSLREDAPSTRTADRHQSHIEYALGDADAQRRACSLLASQPGVVSVSAQANHGVRVVYNTEITGARTLRNTLGAAGLPTELRHSNEQAQLVRSRMHSSACAKEILNKVEVQEAIMVCHRVIHSSRR